MADTLKSGVSVEASPEQISFANILFWGAWTGLVILIVTYLLYVTGVLTPHVPVDVVTQLWSKPVHTYVEKGNVPQGWGWVSLLHTGDFLNFVGIVILAALTVVAYLPLIPALWKKGDKIYTFIAIVEVLVLAAAASGLIAAGE